MFNINGIRNNPEFIRGLFNILLVAGSVTLFELLLFYVVVRPGIEGDINRALINANDNIDIDTEESKRIANLLG